MFVVVTSTDPSPQERKIEVDEVSEGVCDPCLIGQWSVDMETLETFYEASPGALDMELNGTVRFEFKGASGAATAEVTDQRDFTMTVQGQSIVRDGSGAAQYSSDEQFLTITDYVESGVVNVLNSSSPFAGLATAGGAGSYTCEGNDLTVTRPEGASFVAIRDPATPKGEPYFGG